MHINTYSASVFYQSYMFTYVAIFGTKFGLLCSKCVCMCMCNVCFRLCLECDRYDMSTKKQHIAMEHTSYNPRSIQFVCRIQPQTIILFIRKTNTSNLMNKLCLVCSALFAKPQSANIFVVYRNLLICCSPLIFIFTLPLQR